MTILTATGSEKPKEAQVLINPETTVKVEFKQSQRDARKQQRNVHAAINDLIHSRRRRHLAMNIVVAIAALLVIVTGIFGGMYIYKWISYSNKVSAQGTCTVRYHDEMRLDGYAQAQVQPAMQPKPPRREDGRRRPGMEHHGSRRQHHLSNRNGGANQFVENYNVLNSEQEMLQVSQLGFNPFRMQPITVIHDFTAKLTAIVDMWGGRCFIKPLDPEVVPPRDFVDLLRRVEDGTYVPNVCLVFKHYTVVQPALDAAGMSGLRSDIIARTCGSFTTYKMTRSDKSTTLPPSTTRRMLIGGKEDYMRPLPVAQEIEEPAVVLGGKTDPDNPQYRAKRNVDEDGADEPLNLEVPIDLQLEDQPLSVVKKPVDADADGQELAMEAKAPQAPPVESDEDTDADDDSDNELPGTQVEAGNDGDDIVVNLGFGGSETVEVALIHFELPQDDDAAAGEV